MNKRNFMALQSHPVEQYKNLPRGRVVTHLKAGTTTGRFDLHAELAELANLPQENPSFEPMTPQDRERALQETLAHLAFLK